MSDNKNIDIAPEKGQQDPYDPNITLPSAEVSSVAGSVSTAKTPQRVSSSSERQIKFERAQKCLENAALVSKRIKEHRKATAELLGRPFEDDDGGDTASEITSTVSERTSYSVATDTSTTLSVQDALNIPGISESLANTLKQKELLMERIKQYKEITKRSPIAKSSTLSRRETTTVDSKLDLRKSADNNEQLINALKEKENTLSVLQVKMKAMETTILDLQEKITEKDQIIEAKNKATTLMSDSLSKKEKDSMVLLEDTRQQMTKMQENFINMETEWKEEKQRLLKDIEVKEEKIKNLEQANSILETSRFEISVEHSKLLEDLESKNKEIKFLEEQIQNLSQQLDEKPSEKEKDDFEEEKGSKEISDMVELTKRIELLEQLNCQIRQTNKELENRLATMNTESKPVAGGSPSKKGSPLPTRKGGRNTASKQKSPWSKISSESLPQETDKKITKNEIAKLEMVVQSLNKDILDKEFIITQKDELITELQHENKQKEPLTKGSDVVDVGIGTDVIDEPKSIINELEVQKEQISTNETSEEQQPTEIKELEQKLKEAQEQIDLLNADIDAANKNMIKVKSSQKLKLKQMQKTIDNFSKVSDTNAEIVKLNEEIHQLSQKVAELEEEKGNLQLHLVDYDSGRLTESDVYKKLVDAENLAEQRLKAISVLETQKFELVQELHILQQRNMEMEDKLADMCQIQSEQVTTEIKSVELEEQIDNLTASKKELEIIIENLKLDKDQLNNSIKVLEREKEELHQKLENYIQENMDLTDKLEKLSAEKVSSAESIEIVESLTTQEKLELEEYNKGLVNEKTDDTENVSQQSEKNIDNLIEQSHELNKKIQLFTEEREEVMEKMNKITFENESLQEEITELKDQCGMLQNNIDQFNKEKYELQELNQELIRQIDELKRERLEIIKETVEITKPTHEDTADVAMSESLPDDKLSTEKGMNRTKSVKQLTKEILKLKNTIKEREAEIGDCQMKILSLEEQQQKQNEVLQSNASNEAKIKSLTEENCQLKEELSNLQKDKEAEQQKIQYEQAHDRLQQEVHKMQQEYSATISTRDARINELESVLLEYEKQMFNYNNTLQQKDKDLAEYINQITKLNDISQKLKSTIDLLEEEKAKDQNAELVKSLNKQITAYQKKINENEEKLRILEEEKAQLISVKSVLENKSVNLESELQRLQENYAEKQNLIKELQALQQKHLEELSDIKTQSKERDEEIHEIKLQLRKESIENEKLRNTIDEKEKSLNELMVSLDDAKEKVDTLSLEKNALNDQFEAVDTKNKELLEKLKKFAINIKKKTLLYTELENQLIETQKQIEAKNEYIDQLSIQVETLPTLQEKLKHAEEEINRIQSLKITIDQQKSQDIIILQNQLKTFEESLAASSNEISNLNDTINNLNTDLQCAHEEINNQKSQIDILNNKIAEYEIEQRNNMNLSTKISSLESELHQKQNYITELSEKLENRQQNETQIQFGYDAKLQERDAFIESLETEISKYKARIGRLEESISVMEDRRHSLERKADQLGNQLQEKMKAYSEYTNQEDELVSRLANLMDHDRVVEKQLHEIDGENKELQLKLQQLTEDNQRLRQSLSDIQEYCNTLVEKASRADFAEAELGKYQSQARDLEANLKRVTKEHQTLLVQKKKDFEDLESEFNTQIENAFKEKKALGEKYEKVIDHVSQIETKLSEYKANNEMLNASLQELNRVNEQLMIEKSSYQLQPVSQDYTDQYITEINNLNAVLNTKNEEILELSNRMQAMQTHNLTTTSNYDSKISELSYKLQELHAELKTAGKEIHDLRHANEQLQDALSQKENYIKELKETKSLTFEMNIPKTEGMLISSKIEPMSEEPKLFNMSNIESQILSDAEISAHEPQIQRKQLEKLHKTSADNIPSGSIEAPIVAKKAYPCYKKDDDVTVEADPFNSDEGWGFGESGEVASVTPGISHLNEQILKLTLEKDKLQSDLESSNIKLIKVLKKLKELKASNDVLMNELKLSKQISQSSFLDSAIEDELKLKVEKLEKNLAQVTADLNKERIEKESVKKQNEVFNNANDRLTEMKERLENELDLWKYKFKEANDKMSTLQWESDSKDSPKHETSIPSDKNDKMKSEMLKLERENDELQQNIDQLILQNNELINQQTQYKNEVITLKAELDQRVSSLPCENCEILKAQVLDLQDNNTKLIKSMELLNEKLREVEVRCNELIQNYDNLKIENEKIQKDLQNDNKELTDKCVMLQDEVEQLKKQEIDSSERICSLLSEQESISSKLLLLEQQSAENQNTCSTELAQKYASLEEQSLLLRNQLLEANNKVTILETTNEELSQQNKAFAEQIDELNTKIQNLNSENDSLLSTVAELRNSVSSAVDQRGFEIAELWKQHLAQRENDFQKTELELRNQISAAEAKYEQLLDSVQSSSQEETNKLVIMEQVNSLQSKLADKEEHLRDLQDKYAEVINQMDMLRSEMQDEKITHENKILEQQEEYEKVIQELNTKHKELSLEHEVIVQSLRTEMELSKSGLELSKTECEKLRAESENWQRAIQVQEKTIEDLHFNIRQKETDTYQKVQELTAALTTRDAEFENVRQKLVEYEKVIEDLNFEKESELAVLRLKMHENSDYYEKQLGESEKDKTALTEELQEKIVECTSLSKQIVELRKELEEHSNGAAETQAALENQELEIVTLKDEITHLESLLRSSTSKIQKHVSFASDTKPGSEDSSAEGGLNRELLDAVPRAELDLALYMLHQRDVRCEELTMELTQLLEERDTLQLRLSDSLRVSEELKVRCKDAGLEPVELSQEAVLALPSMSIEREQQMVSIHGQTSRSSSVSDHDADKPKLQAKLTELRSVKHSRDVTLRQDSEARQLGMRLLQRDVAQLPPEAVHQLAQAQHTLSRDSQSTPTVLLNWLRGKSTPKVVHM